MNKSVLATSRYSFGFTSGALLRNDAAVVAPMFLDLRDWSIVKTQIKSENLLQARTVSSGRRRVAEVTKRLECLQISELQILVEGTATERSHLLWVAACRRYRLIREFAEEVLRERYLVMKDVLSYEDFDSFIRSKGIWHQEIGELKESTRKKLRSNLFLMLVEAGLINEQGRIYGTVLSDRIIQVLSEYEPNNLLLFPLIGGSIETKAG